MRGEGRKVKNLLVEEFYKILVEIQYQANSWKKFNLLPTYICTGEILVTGVTLLLWQ